MILKLYCNQKSIYTVLNCAILLSCGHAFCFICGTVDAMQPIPTTTYYCCRYFWRIFVLEGNRKRERNNYHCNVRVKCKKWIVGNVNCNVACRHHHDRHHHQPSATVTAKATTAAAAAAITATKTLFMFSSSCRRISSK